MKINHWVVNILVFVLISFSVNSRAALDADEIMQKNFFVSKLKKLQKSISMTLTNDRGEVRQRKIYAVTALQDNGVDSNMLVRFISPADAKGTAFLKIEHLDGDDDQWIFLPAMHKSRRLVSSNKKDSFLGSDFSYGDVLPPKISLYRNKLIAEKVVDGSSCFVIESVPSDDNVKRDYGYSRKITWIGKEHFHETKVEYYDLSNKLLKTQSIRNIILVDRDHNRWVANYREMTNHQNGHKTLFVADKYSTEVVITNKTFSLRNLETE